MSKFKKKRLVRSRLFTSVSMLQEFHSPSLYLKNFSGKRTMDSVYLTMVLASIYGNVR